MNKAIPTLIIAIFLLSACNSYRDYRLDTDTADFKQTCWGTNTYSCVNKRVEVNIEMLEAIKRSAGNNKERTVQQLGEQGYEAAIAVMDEDIEAQKADRPGLFRRWFSGGTVVPYPVPRQYLIGPEYMDSLVARVRQRLGSDYRPPGLNTHTTSETSNANEVPPQPQVGPSATVPVPNSASSVSGPVASTATTDDKSVASPGTDVAGPTKQFDADRADVSVVRKLYDEFTAGVMSEEEPKKKQESLFDQPPGVLQQYFTVDISDLIQRDTACAARTQEICNLDFDPIWDSQDPSGATVKMTADPAMGIVRVTISYPDGEKHLVFRLSTTSMGWRVANITYGQEKQTLRDILKNNTH